MKDKIFIFIIGLLVGAVITASGFLIYEKTNKDTSQMPNGERMQMMERPDGEMPPERPDGETPPEKPSDEGNDSSKTEPPSKNNSSSNNKTKSEGNM